ncbi:polysaccharide biosynthesis/export family protein [Aurantiacibacter hainanensis]|uniref:polysaccharide biosynthesis/export family protein n=1 Tax=Aurantiacibacter hainanensis TaxID=3076114 RepID=UPI0030C6B2A6
MTIARHVLVLALGATLLAGCAIPRGGPSITEIVDQEETNIPVVPITQWRADEALAPPAGIVPDEFSLAGSTDFEELRSGDILNVTISEAGGDGTFPVTLAGPVTIEGISVASDGAVTLPFAGRVDASGLTTAELTTAIRQRIDRQLFRPQVYVTRIGSTGRSVTVMGDVTQGGAVELTPQTSSLAAVIGAAGIAREEGAEYVVQVHRDGATAEIGLDTLFSDPTYDIPLQPGDVISLRRDSRFYIIMGSVGDAARVPLPRQDYMLMDALGSARGLEERTADPTGVFVFRRDARLSDGEPRDVVYRMDMSDPVNIFAATDFPLRPGDVVYVSYASFTQTDKVLRAISGVSSLASSATRVR